jgi:hypothetical protein
MPRCVGACTSLLQAGWSIGIDSRPVLEVPLATRDVFTPSAQTLKEMFYVMEFNPTVMCNDFDNAFYAF